MKISPGLALQSSLRGGTNNKEGWCCLYYGGQRKARLWGTVLVQVRHDTSGGKVGRSSVSTRALRTPRQERDPGPHTDARSLGIFFRFRLIHYQISNISFVNEVHPLLLVPPFIANCHHILLLESSLLPFALLDGALTWGGPGWTNSAPRSYLGAVRGYRTVDLSTLHPDSPVFMVRSDELGMSFARR